MTRSGQFVSQPQGYQAFIPAPLPPQPPLEFEVELAGLLSRADLALGRLDGVTGIIPNPDLFVAMYVKQEAVLSSQIEGTQASLTDVLRFELDEDDEPRVQDAGEVVNYVRALNYGLERLSSLPLSLRLIKEIHAELMAGVRGQEKSPGEFRSTQNWIGAGGAGLAGASFVPPPPRFMHEALGNLETFLHDESLPALVHAAVAHAQFETIHPFLDGNGRMGRLLITFLLCHRQVLARPLLYLSHYLKQHRQEYYDRLQAVRTRGDWEGWLRFFLRGVAEVATEANTRARTILAMRDAHRAQLAQEGKASGNLLRVLDLLFEHPLITPNLLANKLECSFPAANGWIHRLSELGLLTEQTGQRRNRRFAYTPYLQLFELGER